MWNALSAHTWQFMPKCMSNLFDVQGFPELQRKIQSLANDKDKRKEIIAVLKRSAAPTVSAARAEAPISKKPHTVSGKRTKKVIQPGALRKSIAAIAARRSQNPTVVVGPRAKGSNDGFYGAMVEHGHNVYRSGFKRKRSNSAKAKAHNAAGATGTTRADPFMRRTYDKTGAMMSEKTAANLAKFIQKRIDTLSTR
jgi:Bacteriophage HK97-gp10, putative tail-component